MDKENIITLFEKINEYLKQESIQGEISVFGGAAMVLAFDARAITKNIDAIFKPTDIIRQIALNLAETYNLPEDWLNDAVKGFIFSDHQKFCDIILEFSNLKITAPNPKYLLAMKCFASRLDSKDKEDIIFLIQKIGIKTPDEVFDIIQHFIPQKNILPKTQFLIQQIFEN
jgi:hypothetical protein